MKNLPNLITSIRILLSLLVFAALAAAGGQWPGVPPFDNGLRTRLIGLALTGFVLAALTDFVDGWLARRLDARSVIGTMLDPIADKVAVVAAILGVAALDPGLVIWPGALILMRELFVAGLRETGARLPVTGLAKWKTTVQLTSLTLAIAAQAWFGLRSPALVLLWMAAGLSLWTGLDYLIKTLKSLESDT